MLTDVTESTLCSKTIFFFSVNRVKIRWKSLRDAFVKQQRKRQDCTAKVRPYIYESEMQFLLPHILLKDRDTDGYESGNESISVPVSNFEVKTEDCPSLNASLSGDSHLDETIDPDAPPLIKELIWDDKQHPIDAFFYGIAQTVKQFKPITAARVKKAVANIVIDAEIEDIATN